MSRWRGFRGAAATLAIMALAAACADTQGPDAVIHVVEVSPLTAIVTVGDTVRLTARPKGPDGTVRESFPVGWVSRHADLATVTGQGHSALVLAHRAGLAEINAQAAEKIGVAMVEVRNPAPQLATLVPAEVIAGGAGFTLEVRGTGFVQGSAVEWNGSARQTEYVSATVLRAAIFATDIATAGQAEVRVVNAAPGGGASPLLMLNLAPSPVVWVDMQPDTATVLAGQTVTLSATARDIHGNDLGRPLTWSTTNPAVATVSGAGIVTGVATGIAIINAATDGGYASAVIKVNPAAIVTPRITSISPDSLPSQPSLVEITIRGAGFNAGVHAFIDSSSRPSEVLSDSVMTMMLWAGDIRTSGTRTIRLSNGAPNGMSNAATLRIYPGVWTVRIDPAPMELWPGESQQFTATAYDEQDRPVTGRAVTWKSTDPATATVDASGRVRAVSSGNTLIEARVDGRAAYEQVTVLSSLPWDLLYEGNHGGLTELWLLTVGPNTAPRRLLPAGTYGADPAASPDGSRIAYVGIGSNGYMNIFVVNRDGTNPQQLTFTQDLNDQPAWSRDGSQIAFRRQGNRSDIWVMNADGSGQTNITNNAARTDAVYAAERPTWTPAGRVVFTFGYQNLNPLRYQLVTTRADGGDWKTLTDGITFSEFEPEVSPNGSRIALRRVFHGNNPQLTTDFIDIIAGDGTQLGWIFLPGEGRTPSWSPDGQYLTYSHSTSLNQSTIYTTRLGTAERRVLVQGGRNPVFIQR